MNRFLNLVALFVFAVSIVVGLAGCSNEDDRKPTKEEGQAADVKRQQFIDSLNLPADKKAAMKARMGGPAVVDPSAAARDAAGANAKGKEQSRQ